MSDQKQKIDRFFNGLRSETMDSVRDFYHPECVFEDPITHLEGVEAMQAYYTHMYRNVREIRFDFPSMIEEGDEVAAIWNMTMRVDGLAKGEPVTVPGISRIRFENGLAKYHRDYFDMGAFVYEHVPLLRGVIGYIKRKLHG